MLDADNRSISDINFADHIDLSEGSVFPSQLYVLTQTSMDTCTTHIALPT